VSEGNGGSNLNNVLQFGPGITASQITVTEDSTNDIYVTDGVTGDQVKLDNEMTNNIYGVQQVLFADGTSLSRAQLIALAIAGTAGANTIYGPPNGSSVFDGKGAPSGSQDKDIASGVGDTFIFDAGYGHLEVSEGNGGSNLNNVLQFGPGITASQITVTEDSTNDIYVTDGVTGDQVKLDNEMTNNIYGVQQVLFADGTSLSRAQLIALAIAGTTGANTIYGPPNGSSVFDGKGAPSGSQDKDISSGVGDTFIFDAGYGHLEVSEGNGGSNLNNVLQFGPGITASQITVTEDSSNSIYITDGVTGDQVKLDNEMTNNIYGVQQVLFADGTSLDKSQLQALETTGTTGADILYGAAGTDRFDGKGAPSGSSDTEIGKGGDDTYVFNRGYGQLNINNVAGTAAHGQLDFGPGLTEQDLWFVHSGNNLVIDRLGSSDSVTIQGWFTGTGSTLSEIVSSDGLKLDSQLSQLVSAMATYASANIGFNPLTATQMPTDSTLQNTIAASWHS
jgi:hypothetical protein